MIGEFLTATFQYTKRCKIFQWVKFLFRRSSNLRKLSRQKFYNELACVFTAHDASKNADSNQQQLMDGGILANWNSANYPYCFLSNQKKVHILTFLHVIRQRNVSCPLPVRDINGYQGEGMISGYHLRADCSLCKTTLLSVVLHTQRLKSL